MGSVQDAIHARRSIRTFAARPVDRAVVQRLLDAGTQAPNHRLTRPWRFFVLDRPGSKRDELTHIAEELAFQAMPEPRDDRARERARSRASEVAKVPVLILAYSTPGRDEHETRENYAAVACSLQNVQLAAVEEGLASGWSTGGIVRDAAIRSAVGADEDWEFVGALYVGYPGETPPAARERPGATQVTRWLSD
ncbi:MAG: nitroreductase [Chloroflexi bacterium]|nr:nitroreductase [Chloroflexota bacterium]